MNMIHTSMQVFEAAGKPFRQHDQRFSHRLSAGEALVRIQLATICGSDLHTICGARQEDTPCILGHEAVGEIVAAREVSGFSLGDRVTWTIADSCGECEYCTRYGLPEKCERLFKYGHASLDHGSGLNGCYASHIVIRSGTTMVKIPESVSNATAAPANCALATMVNAIAQMNVTPRNVVVQGGGLLGLYACALLREAGAERVFCVEINADRFDLISRFGGTPVDGKGGGSAVNQILACCPQGVDAVFEVAGVKELVSQGVDVLRCGGFYALVGLVHPDSALSITGEQIIRKNLTIRGVHNYAAPHLQESIRFLERNLGTLPFADLVSPPFALCDLEDAIVEARKQRWARVSIQP